MWRVHRNLLDRWLKEDRQKLAGRGGSSKKREVNRECVPIENLKSSAARTSDLIRRAASAGEAAVRSSGAELVAPRSEIAAARSAAAVELPGGCRSDLKSSLSKDKKHSERSSSRCSSHLFVSAKELLSNRQSALHLLSGTVRMRLLNGTRDRFIRLHSVRDTWNAHLSRTWLRTNFFSLVPEWELLIHWNCLWINFIYRQISLLL